MFLVPIIQKDEIIYTSILVVTFVLILLIKNGIMRRIGMRSEMNEARVNLISRYITILMLFGFFLIIAFIFGMKLKDLVVLFSSVFAVLGIGLFATWSILSNITSGIILFFSFPYKVGDKIKILDKDFPIEAVIEDIKGFQLHLREDNGNLITYPTNLILQKPVTLLQKDAMDEMIDN